MTLKRARKKRDPGAWVHTPEGHAKYLARRAEAQARANSTGFDHYVLRNDAFHDFMVGMLPEKRNRYGSELSSEVVSCENLDRCARGHGPLA